MQYIICAGLSHSVPSLEAGNTEIMQILSLILRSFRHKLMNYACTWLQVSMVVSVTGVVAMVTSVVVLREEEEE